jgi:hypothetical protein
MRGVRIIVPVFWPKAILTVAWGKRSAAPGRRNPGFPLAESQTHSLVNDEEMKLACSQSNVPHS